MSEVILHERGDEVVTVVIPRLSPDGHRVPYFFGSLLEQMRVQLLLQKLIRQPLINENRAAPRRVRHARNQLRGIVLRPLPAICSEITSERLLSPRALSGSR